MSWGCIVCGQSTGPATVVGMSIKPGTDPLCADCRVNGQMEQTNRSEEYPIYVRIDADGPHFVDVIEIADRST